MASVDCSLPYLFNPVYQLKLISGFPVPTQESVFLVQGQESDLKCSQHLYFGKERSSYYYACIPDCIVYYVHFQTGFELQISWSAHIFGCFFLFICSFFLELLNPIKSSDKCQSILTYVAFQLGLRRMFPSYFLKSFSWACILKSFRMVSPIQGWLCWHMT